MFKKKINRKIEIKCKAVAVLSAEIIIVKVTNKVSNNKFNKKNLFL